MSAVEGVDTTAAIRARLDELYVLPAARQRYYGALLAVLDHLDHVIDDGPETEGEYGLKVGLLADIAIALGVEAP